jgi:hypothetical protein
MGLDCTVLGMIGTNQTRLLDAARNGMISKVKGTLLSERPVDGGREVRFRVDDHEAIAWLFLEGGKLLIAKVFPVDAFPETSTQRFFESLASLSASETGRSTLTDLRVIPRAKQRSGS